MLNNPKFEKKLNKGKILLGIDKAINAINKNIIQKAGQPI
jgi:hypothetical protein